jgi:hypothetical protein
MNLNKMIAAAVILFAACGGSLAAAAGQLDDFENLNGWSAGHDTPSTVKLRIVPGKQGKALGIDYDLASGKWVTMEKTFPLDILKNDILSFWVKAASEGCQLEFKVVNSDGGVFGKRFGNLTDSWQLIEVPINELEHWWGGSETRLLNPDKISFAVSGENGGKGIIALDALGLGKSK